MKKYYIYLLLTTIGVIFLISCENSTTPKEKIKQPGFCLTFDDTYVAEWDAIAGMLDSNNVKATFFITLAYSLDSTDFVILNNFENLGHEIGSHGWQHINAIDYLNNHSIKEYVTDEIMPSVNYLESKGLNIRSFSYPYGYNTDSLDSEMLKIFVLLRDVTEEQRKPTGRNINEIDEIYYKFDDKKIVAGLGIDKNFKIDYDMLEEGFKRAYENDEVIVFYCHKPVKKASAPYQIEYEYLGELFTLAHKYDLKSYTFSELVN